MLDSRTPPLVLGRYELHSAIAMGGMASIHLGRLRGASGFARTVAIKRLHPHYARDPLFVSMFMEEARLVARIRHPNVVPILDVVSEGDELFLVMDYVHGESLARLVHDRERGSVPVAPNIAAAIFADILHGLHAAHEAKTPEGEPLAMVHRDVTPHNVLVGVDGSARIADFGIAKATRRDQASSSGLLKGKLFYFAPEQIHGRAVGRTTDVYAAAVSLWEALTGRPLFAADNEALVLEKILTGATRPPSAFATGIPPELDDIVMHGLEMQPHKRFLTAHEMALALEKSVALPSPSEIGAWVQARADRAVAERVALIESLERMPPVEIAPPPSSTLLAMRDHSHTPISTAMPALPPAARARSNPHWRVAAFVGLVSVGVGAVLSGALWAHARLAPAVKASRSQAAGAAQPVATTQPAAMPTASGALVPVGMQAPSPAPAPAADHAVDKGATRHSPSHGAADKKKVLAAPSATVTVDAPSEAKDDDACKLPHTRDDMGSKVYKRECL